MTMARYYVGVLREVNVFSRLFCHQRELSCRLYKCQLIYRQFECMSVCLFLPVDLVDEQYYWQRGWWRGPEQKRSPCRLPVPANQRSPSSYVLAGTPPSVLLGCHIGVKPSEHSGHLTGHWPGWGGEPHSQWTLWPGGGSPVPSSQNHPIGTPHPLAAEHSWPQQALEHTQVKSYIRYGIQWDTAWTPMLRGQSWDSIYCYMLQLSMSQSLSSIMISLRHSLTAHGLIRKALF